MIVPKDAHVVSEIGPEVATFSWPAPKWDKWGYGAPLWVFGILFVMISFTPKVDLTPRDPSMLQFGIGLIVVGIFAFWLGSLTRTTIRATKNLIEIFRVPFRPWRSHLFQGAPVQFYLTSPSSSTATTFSRTLRMIGPDGVSHELVRGLNPTMASQLWYELQEFFELEDLDVLGEFGHQSLAEFRRIKRD